jgi:hypothetical protein
MNRYSIGLILFSIFIMNNVCGQQTDKKKVFGKNIMKLVLKNV